MQNTFVDIILRVSLNGPELEEGCDAVFKVLGPAIQAFKCHRARFPQRTSAGLVRRKRKLEKGDLLCELAGLEEAIYDEELPENANSEGMDPLVLPVAHRENDEQVRLREEHELQEERAQLAAVGRFEVPVGMRALPVPVDMSKKVIRKKKDQDRFKIAHRLCSGWEMGTLVQEETSKKKKGLFSVRQMAEREERDDLA